MTQSSPPLAGMRDSLEAESRRHLGVQRSLQATLTLAGYHTVDTPVLEPTDIFLRKSGGELASQMYSFVEPGGRRVSLRPEFTAQVMRLFIQRAETLALPARWQYAGPVFRYAPDAGGQTRQYTQVGAELIGASGAAAEAEVMALACTGLAGLGLGPLRLTLGDVGAVHRLLRQFALSDRATHFLLGSISQLREGPGETAALRLRAEELGLIGPAARQDMPMQALRLAAEDTASAAPFGGRTSAEVLARLIRKLTAADDPDLVERALSFASAVAQRRGEPDDTLAAARALAAEYRLDPAPIDTLAACLEALVLHDLPDVDVEIDLGLAGGIAYYSGPLFEVHGGAGTALRLVGGGRYDGLVKALGGDADVPAIGFAYNLERVVEAAEDAAHLGGDNADAGVTLVAPQSAGAVRAALRVAATLRRDGAAATVAHAGGADAKTARTQGYTALVTVGEDGACERTQL